MSDQESPADKPHDPTPARLEEARRKGEIVRSADLNGAVAYGGFLLAFALLAGAAGQGLGALFLGLLDQADSLAPLMLSPGGRSLAGGVMAGAVWPVLILVGVPAGLVLAGLVAQRAILFSPEKLRPRLSRIAPLQMAKNKFGPNGLFEFAKSAAKLAIYTVLVFWLLWRRTDEILAAIHADPGQILQAMGRLGLDFLTAVLLVSALIAVADYLWQWHAHLKKHRMSHQELIDETKRSEGDPQHKQQRRQRGYDIAMNKMLADVPGADVVVVNPTHFAVALKWDRAGGQVPVCVARGVDEIARQIRLAAAGAGVPVFHDPPTARALHATLDIGQEIAPDQFRAVAAAIRFADRMRRKARAPLR